MKICNATEPGFYVSRNGTVFEVLKNPDSEWLSEEPSARLILDVWSYRNTENGKRIYKSLDRNWHYLSEFGDSVSKSSRTYHLIGDGDYLQED